MAISSEGLYEPRLLTDLVNKVEGHSALSQLSTATPIPFNGTKEFTFNFDKEIDVVAENGKKTEGGISLSPTIIRPIKVEYGARMSDEFIYASEEEQINFLQAFNDGFARKLAKGLDLMAVLGVNPRTGRDSEVIGENAFVKKIEDDKKAEVDLNAAQTGKGNLDSAIGQLISVILEDNASVSGGIITHKAATALAETPVDGAGQGVKKYPQLAWGANPGSLNGVPLQVSNNLSFGGAKNVALFGDFANSFRWGYTKQIPLEIIKYGDPDNSGYDLKGYNQVYVRAETYLGWGILEPKAFGLLTDSASVSTGE